MIILIRCFSAEPGLQPPKRNKEKEHKKKKLKSITSLPNLTAIDGLTSPTISESRSNSTVKGKEIIPPPEANIGKEKFFVLFTDQLKNYKLLSLLMIMRSNIKFVIIIKLLMENYVKREHKRCISYIRTQ